MSNAARFISSRGPRRRRTTQDVTELIQLSRADGYLAAASCAWQIASGGSSFFTFDSINVRTGVRFDVANNVSLLAVITYLDRVCIAVAGPRMQDELHISPEAWGWVTSVFLD